MKTMKRALALFLAMLMCFGVLPPAATATFVQTSVIGKEYTLQNDYIKVTVNSKNGRFSIQTVEGQKVRKNDQNTFLSFIGGLFGDGVGDSDTSFTTFRINGTDYIFGNAYSIPTKNISSTMGETKVFTHAEYEDIPEGCQAVVTPWTIEGVTITQLLLLFPETDQANSGNVQIFYQIDNKSGAEVKVGARILLDTMVGSNDGPEFQIGTISSNTLKVERMLSKDPVKDQNIAEENKNYWTMPGYWVMKDTLDPTNPLATNVIAYGYTDIASYRDLDYMIVSHWNKLANEKYEEFLDYRAIPPEQTEAAAEVSRTQRIAERAAALAEQKEAEAVLKEDAAVGAETGTKADLDAKKARADADKVKKAAEEAAKNYETAKAALAQVAGGRTQIGSSIIDPNLDFTDDKNDYGSADSAVAFYWRGDTEDARIPAGGKMQLGTVYGLGEIIDPTSVLAISFPNPVTQMEVNPNDQSMYKNYGMFDINVEVENLASQNMKHDSIDITMTLEKGLRFVKRDEQGNILRDSSGAPLTSYGTTQVVTYEKALTPEQAEAGEKNPILPGEKIAATFTVVASGKPWPTTRQYMVTASSPQLESEFESKYGESAGDDVKALYNASRANFIFLPAVGTGTPSYSTSVSPEECFTKDPKYITVNLTNIEAYNPGSSVRGQEANANFNLFFEEIVTGKRYQIDVTDNVQCIPTDDGLTGDMRISYTNGTLVDADGIVLETDLGYELPMGEYRVAIDYISTDEDENAMLDMVTEQTFLVTENEEARIREPGVLAVVKETVDFDDGELMQKINDLVAEVQAAIEELEKIAEKLESTDWSEAIYDEVVDFAKELVSPVTKIYDDLEKLTDFSNIEAEMRELSKSYDELADVDFSSIADFDIGAAIKGVNVDVSLSDELKKQLSVESLLLGPLGLEGITDLADGGVEGVYDSIKNYGKNALSPITDIYDQIASLGDFSSLSDNEIAKLKASFSELQDVDFDSLKNLELSVDASVSLKTDALAEKFAKIFDVESILMGPLGTDGVDGIYDSIKAYGADMVKPITNLYDDILELADFSTLTEEEFNELKKAYSDLEGIDYEKLVELGNNLGDIISDTVGNADISVNLSNKFKALVDIETLIKGPFATGEGSKNLYDWLQDYAKKVAAPVFSIYDDFEDLTDFSDIAADMEELSKTYKELEGIDFSCLEDFDINALIDGIDVDVSLSDKFKELYDYEAILAGPFASDDPNETWMDVFEKRITDYGKKALSPILSIYDDIESLADFDNIAADMEGISKSFDELESVDFSFLEDYDIGEELEKLWNAASVDVDLSNEFKEKYYDPIVKGPVDGNGDFDLEQLEPWMIKIGEAIEFGQGIYNLGKDAYQSKDPKTCAAALVTIYKQVLNVNIDIDSNVISAALDKAKATGAKTWSEGEKMAMAFVAMYARMQNIYSGLEVKYNKAKGIVNDVMEIKDKIVSVVTAVGNGDFSALLSLGEDMLKFVLGEWLDPVYNAYESTMDLYDIGRRAYEGKMSVREGAQLLVDFCEKYLDLSISVDPGKTNIEAGKQLYNNSEKLVLAFMAMYARMQNLYSSIGAKVDRAKEVYDQARDLVNTVIKVGGNLLSGDFSDLGNFIKDHGMDVLNAVLNAWLEPAQDTINAAMDIYAIGQKAYAGKLSAREGARLLMSFYESYLDVDVNADLSGLKAAGGEITDSAQKVAAAFMVMYARMQNIYSTIGSKVDRAKEVYDQAKDIVNAVIKLVKAIGSGDMSAIVDKLLEMGTDIVSTVINIWISRIEEALDSVKDIYKIAEHAYKGDLSLREGAQLLVDFYENYLDVSIKADLKGAGNATEQSKKVAAAFMVMYAQMKSIYSTVSSKLDTAKKVYNQAKSIIATVIKLVSDPMAAVNDIINMGKDAIFDILNAYLDKINEMIDSVKDIYEIGKKAYEGNIDIKEGAELLIGFYEKYLNVTISADLDAVGEKNKKAASDTYKQGKKMALAFMAMYARMKNIYSGMNAKYNELTGIYDQMMEIVDTVMKLFTDPASGAFALMDMVKARIMTKLDGLGMYKDMFLQVLDVIEDFDSYDPSELVNEAMSFAVTTARVKADQALYSTIYGMLVTAATTLDPNSDYEWDPGELKKSLPTYRLMAFADEAELKEYQDKIDEQNKKKKAAAKDEKEKAAVGNDGVLVKITGMIRQIGEGANVTDYIVDTSTEPAIINNTVAFKGGDLVFTQGKLKISFGDVATIDAGEYISKAQSIYGSETPLFDTLFVSGTGQLYIEGSGFVFHEGEWSLDFYNGFDKILDPVVVEKKEDESKNKNAESDALNETAAWAIGALNDLFNPLKALAITDVYFNRHTLFSAPSFSVAGFGLKFDNYLLRSNEVCFGGHIDFKIVKGEIQNVFFNSEGLQSIEADLKFDLGGDLGLLEKGETAGGNLIIHYYDPDYLASFKDRGYDPPEEKYGLDFSAKLKSVGGVGVQISFKRVADGRILPDIIGFQADPPAPGILVTGGTYLTEIRGAIKELADTIAGGSSTVPLTIEAGVDITFGQAPAVFNGKIDMILKMTGIEFNGTLGYKGKPMITQAQIKAQWVTPWFVSASMEMDVLGLNIIIGKARLFIGQNLEKDRIDFEGFVSAALQIPKSVPVVGGFQLGQVSFGLNNDKIWGSASVGVTPIAVSVGITYYWGGGVEFGTDGEGLPEAYTYLLLERPEEEPVLVAIGSGMRTEATSWVNEDTIHAIEYHAIGDGVTLLDNGQNDIGLGGIEVSNKGKTHVIPVGSVAADRDALIEIEYYGEEKTEDELEAMLKLNKGIEDLYGIRIGDMSAPQPVDTAFKQELVTEDGVNRHLVYVMVPHKEYAANKSFTLNADERVQTKLLSTPIASTLSGVTLTEGDDSDSDKDYKAIVTVANARAGDTVSLYLTRETEGTATEYITTTDENGNEVKLPVTEDKDPGVMIFDGIPVGSGGTVTQAFNLSDICGYGTTETKSNPYAVDGLKDVRELLESGEYYLRAALKSDTGYDAMTSENHITITDPKAPNAASAAALTSVGNGYFNLSFNTPASDNGNPVTAYRVDFCNEDGSVYSNYNGLLFDKADAEKYLSSAKFRLGGWTVTGGEGTQEDPFTYAGLETGKKYIVKVYAASQTADGNYHYATPAVSAVTLLPEPQYVSFTSITSGGEPLDFKYYINEDGTAVASIARELVTARPAPELELVPGAPAKVDAYNGDDLVGHMDAEGKLVLTELKTDGDYAIELRAENTETHDLSVTVVYVTIDTTKPALQITSPGGESVDFRNITLTGTTEPGSTVTANGNAIVVCKDGSFNASVAMDNSLASGEIVLVVTDKAGNTNRAVIPVTNSGYAAPVGINVVRTGTMKTGTTQTAQVYLKYADGKTASGVQKYRSVAVPAADQSKLSFGVVRGDAVTVNNSGVITADREGASLMLVSYKVNDSMSLDTTMAVFVDDDAPVTAPIGGETGGNTGGNTGAGGGGGGGGGAAPAAPAAAAPATADVVINGKSETVGVTEDGTTTIQVGKDNEIDVTERLTVENLTEDATSYVLEVDAEVAKELSGSDGEGVRFTAGGSQVDVPGSVMTGSSLTVTVSEPNAAQQQRSANAAKQLGATAVSSGKTVAVKGASIEPGDKVGVRFTIPAGVDTSEITALVFVDEEGNYTSLPWKLDVAGSTAYVKCELPENGTLVPVSGGETTFSDVSPRYWGAAGIEKAAVRMIIRGYVDGTFRPGNNVTRAEFATVMLRAGGLLTAQTAKMHYTDVVQNSWYYDALSIATTLGVMTGYSDGTVRPNHEITRVESMVIASRMLKLEQLSGELTDAEVDKVLLGFEDRSRLPNWAKKDIALCVKYGIINGINGSIVPNDPLSRVQAAIIAVRLSDAIAKTL